MSNKVHLQEDIVSQRKLAWPSPTRMALRRGGVQIEPSLKIEPIFTTQNETFEFKPGTETTISLLRYVPRFHLYLKNAFVQQMGQNRYLRHKTRLQSHVVLTQFFIVPGLCGKERFTHQKSSDCRALEQILAHRSSPKS